MTRDPLERFAALCERAREERAPSPDVAEAIRSRVGGRPSTRGLAALAAAVLLLVAAEAFVSSRAPWPDPLAALARPLGGPR